MHASVLSKAKFFCLFFDLVHYSICFQSPILHCSFFTSNWPVDFCCSNQRILIVANWKAVIIQDKFEKGPFRRGKLLSSLFRYSFGFPENQLGPMFSIGSYLSVCIALKIILGLQDCLILAVTVLMPLSLVPN